MPSSSAWVAVRGKKEVSCPRLERVQIQNFKIRKGPRDDPCLRNSHISWPNCLTNVYRSWGAQEESEMFLSPYLRRLFPTLNNTRCLWMDHRKHGRYINSLEYWSILSAFCNKRHKWSDLQKNQKSENMTMGSFKGHNGMARISWSNWNSHSLSRKSVHSNEVLPTHSLERISAVHCS